MRRSSSARSRATFSAHSSTRGSSFFAVCAARRRRSSSTAFAAVAAGKRYHGAQLGRACRKPADAGAMLADRGSVRDVQVLNLGYDRVAFNSRGVGAGQCVAEYGAAFNHGRSRSCDVVCHWGCFL